MPQYVEILKTISHNTRELERYVKFIEQCKKFNSETKVNVHLTAHHICPEACDMFPQYSSFVKYPWNRALLTDRQHYLAHMMLWKVYRNKSMTFAFNMMSNFQKIRYGSKLYEKHREDFRKFISKLNARPRTEEEKLNLSIRMKDTLVVYDIRDSKRFSFRINKTSCDYDPKYHIFYRTGSKHSEKTKMKIGRKGKKYCHHTETNDIKLVYENVLPEGYIWGYPKGVYTAEHVKETIWFHNPETKEHIRTKKGSEPEGFIKGRLMDKNPGFDKINSMINVVDLENKKVDKVFIIDRKKHGPESGTSTKKTTIFIFQDKIFTSKKKLIDFLKSIDYYIEIGRNVITDMIEEIMVKKPHFNCSNDVNEFRKKYQDKTYKDLGLKVIKLEMFDISEHREKEIYWGD